MTRAGQGPGRVPRETSACCSEGWDGDAGRREAECTEAALRQSLAGPVSEWQATTKLYLVAGFLVAGELLPQLCSSSGGGLKSERTLTSVCVWLPAILSTVSFHTFPHTAPLPQSQFW